ncbi:RNA chaperone Hfq [Candidatus Riflebacteria bacterium]
MATKDSGQDPPAVRQFNFSVQNEFLNQIRRKQIPVEIFLVTGTCFRGRIVQYDNYSLRLNFKGHTEVIYKSSIATINPVKNVHLNPDRDKPDGYRPYPRRRPFRRSE